MTGPGQGSSTGYEKSKASVSTGARSRHERSGLWWERAAHGYSGAYTGQTPFTNCSNIAS